MRLVGRAAEAGTRLFLSQGSEELELPAVGGQELGPLPWVCQGMGYWHTSNNHNFPFDRPVEHQVERLKSCKVDIRAGYPSYPTYWYIGPG